MTRLVVTALVLSLSLPVRATPPPPDDCAEDDVACILASEVHELTRERDEERAHVDRIAKELAACRATQGACEGLVVQPPAVKPVPYPWPVFVATGSAGIVVGIILGLKLAR